jgi:hypothetical protein
MRYLGALRGSGVLVSPDEELGAATYEIDGYLIRPGEVAASGELRMAPTDLARAFGQRNLRLRTADGRELSVRFTARKLALESSAAHADFGGDLPVAADWVR